MGQDFRGTVNTTVWLLLPLVLSGCLMTSTAEEEAEVDPVPPPVNNAPSISGNPPRMARVGASYSFVPRASDPDGDALTFSVESKPGWASFDSATGELTGVPFLGSEGSYPDIRVTVSDGSMSSSLPMFMITVEPATSPNMPPEIDGVPAPSVGVGEAYSFTPTASDPDGDILTFSSTGKPSWLAFDPGNGRLSGTPGITDAGVHGGISITVSDGLLAASMPAFSITVVVTNSAPTISGTPATAITVGQDYSFTPDASDADGDTLTFSIANRPSWAAFDTATGTLSGTPGSGDEGDYANITVSVSDGSDSASLAPFSISVSPATLGSAVLTWTPPTENEDGTPLMDLSGYVIYYGLAPGSYSENIPLDNAGLTSYTIDSLMPDTYYFVITAVNSAGVQSTFSNEASKTIP